MKNTFLFSALLLTVAAGAQQTTSETTQEATTTEAFVQASVPAHLKDLTSDQVKPTHFLPALGSFQSDAGSNVTVTVDETNLGMVWVEGLAVGRFKALMKQRPATYKIPAQKTESGKSIGEGTLMIDAETGALNILIGKPYNEATPAAAFAASKSQKGQVVFKGTKQDGAQ